MYLNSHDISDEFVLRNFKSGIKLAKPGYDLEEDQVGEIFKLPTNIFFLKKDSTILKINETNIQEMGCVSEKEIIGKTIEDFADWRSAFKIMNNDKFIVQSQKTKITDEVANFDKVNFINCLSIKMPWYNDNNEVIGVFGFSIVLGKHELDTIFKKIISAGLLEKSKFLSSPIVHNDKCKIKLSRRQRQCLQLLIYGKSAREISEIFGLSRRTVEAYINIIKSKFGVTTKSDLLDIASQLTQ